MLNLNVLEIRQKNKFHRWRIDPFECHYYFDLYLDSSLKIFTEYRIIREAQYLHLFELVKNGKGFILRTFTKKELDADFIGKEKEAVVRFVTEEIIKRTTSLGEHWAESRPNKKTEFEMQKAKLEKALRKKVEEFINNN